VLQSLSFEYDNFFGGSNEQARRSETGSGQEVDTHKPVEAQGVDVSGPDAGRNGVEV
jgi:hypothetical protein